MFTRRCNGIHHTRSISVYVSYAAVLDVYDLEQILEFNDKTTEDCLEYLVEEGYIELPRIKPLDFEWLITTLTLSQKTIILFL